jgi:hypothetical protein
MNQRKSTRRQALTILGITTTTGCLRLTDSQQNNGQGNDGGTAFPSESEARATAQSAAISSENNISIPVAEKDVQYGSGKMINLNSNQGTTSSTTSDQGQIISSGIEFGVGAPAQAAEIKSTQQGDSDTQGYLPFGGNEGLGIGFTNVTNGSKAIFTPATDSDSYQMASGLLNMSIDPAISDPASEYDSLSVMTPGGEQWNSVSGSWSFNGGPPVFTGQAFAKYRVDLYDGGTSSTDIISSTNERIFGTNYRWKSAQSAEKLFVTRQPSVSNDWYVILLLGDIYEPVATAEARHLSDSQLLSFNLTDLNADPGQYHWELHFRPTESIRVLQSWLRIRDGTVFIP